MRVCDIKGEWANNLLAGSNLWDRDIEKLRPIDISVFLRRFWGTPQYNEAARQVETLIDRSWHAVVDRQISEMPSIIAFDPLPRSRITVGELCSWLEQTTVPRRRAILFALETGMSISEIISLTWKNLRAMSSLPFFAIRIANSMARHFRLDYVFWEDLPNCVAGPLFGLNETMFEVSQGMGYGAFRSLYQNAIPIHEQADCVDFMEKVQG